MVENDFLHLVSRLVLLVRENVQASRNASLTQALRPEKPRGQDGPHCRCRVSNYESRDMYANRGSKNTKDVQADVYSDG